MDVHFFGVVTSSAVIVDVVTSSAVTVDVVPSSAVTVDVVTSSAICLPVCVVCLCTYVCTQVKHATQHMTRVTYVPVY